MAHMIEKNDTMFSVKQTPWHELGIVLPQAPSIKEAIVAAGLDWQVKLYPLQGIDDKGKALQTEGAIEHRLVVRDDIKSVLGVVGPNFTPLQNIEAFNFFDPFLQSKQVTLETAGSLRDNRTVWVLGKVNGVAGDVVKGDTIERYVLLAHGHDGTMAIRVGYTDIRVVCQNTMNMAFNSKASKLIRVKHSAKAQENLENLRTVMDVVNSEFRANLQQLKLLTRKNINQKDIKNFVHVCFFDSEELKATRTVNMFNDMVENITAKVEAGIGADIKGVRGTMYGLVNAATEYLTHEAQTNTQTRLNSLWFGENSRLNARIMEYALEAAA